MAEHPTSAAGGLWQRIKEHKLIQTEALTTSATMVTQPRDPALSRDPRTVAVLPLNNMSGEAGLDALIDGLSEDFITKLTQDPMRLKIAARNTLVRYRGANVDVRNDGPLTRRACA